MKKPPDSLLEIQKWFGKTISQPLLPSNLLPEISPFGTDTKREAEKYIAPSATLEPYQRVEIYHQQYWWRLLDSMHQNFPFVLRLFGYEGFNTQIAIPYLSCFPPTDWALCKLGLTLPDWINKEYRKEDQNLVLNASEIDVAAHISFWSKDLKPLDFDKMPQNEILEKKITLQPHVSLFHFSSDLFSAREQFLEQEVEYWNTHPFPEIIHKHSYFVLYRSLSNTVKWKEVTFGEYKMLSYFKEGTSINEAIEMIENEAYEEAIEQLFFWFREWTYLKWFSEV